MIDRLHTAIYRLMVKDVRVKRLDNGNLVVAPTKKWHFGILLMEILEATGRVNV